MAKWMHLSWRPTPYSIGNVVRSLTLILNLVKQTQTHCAELATGRRR
ncbi:MAG: hypothetical protein N2V74_06080 [Candidatus Methanospirare jalkutatii]|nr:MAG: hypothetical protein N2V74_06080 [Candidatus Methanospirare jalkutatii]